MTSETGARAEEHHDHAAPAPRAWSDARVAAAATLVGRDHPAMRLDDIVALFEAHLAETESAPVQDYRLLLAERRVRATLSARSRGHEREPQPNERST